jgi:hypothetical protein
MPKQVVEKVTEGTINAGRDKLIAVFTEPRLLEAEVSAFQRDFDANKSKAAENWSKAFPNAPDAIKNKYRTKIEALSGAALAEAWRKRVSTDAAEIADKWKGKVMAALRIG